MESLWNSPLIQQHFIKQLNARIGTEDSFKRFAMVAECAMDDCGVGIGSEVTGPLLKNPVSNSHCIGNELKNVQVTAYTAKEALEQAERELGASIIECSIQKIDEGIWNVSIASMCDKAPIGSKFVIMQDDEEEVCPKCGCSGEDCCCCDDEDDDEDCEFVAPPSYGR